MKRVNENDEGVIENSGFKKLKIFNGIDDSNDVVSGTQGVRERVFTENGAIDSKEIDGNLEFSENGVSEDFGSSSLGGLKQADKCVVDLVFEHDDVGDDIDLNVPIFQGLAQEGPLINRNGPDIIDIVSDDSDDGMEIVRGYTGGNEDKGKEMEISMSYDRTENLNQGYEINFMDNFVGEISLTTGGDGSYAGEEEEMANIHSSWLSLNSFYQIDLDFRHEIPMDVNEPGEDDDVLVRQPEALPAMPILFRMELVIQEAERRRAEAAHAMRIETAKRLARTNHPSSGNGVSSQGKNLPPLDHVEGLGSSPGPFADALKLVRERTSKRAPQDLIEWKPSYENVDRRINALIVPSLLDLSVKALAENAEGLVSLELVPDMLRKRVTDVLCDTRRMSFHTLNLLVKGDPTEIRIKNCTGLTEEQFQQAFKNCKRKDLVVLQLDLCGQLMLDIAFRDISSQSSINHSSLAILSLRGACRLSDSELKELVLAAPCLRSVNLGQCPLLTCDGINFMADCLGSNLRELYIDSCPKINAITLLPTVRKFKCLEVLSVAEIQSVTDQFISKLSISCGQTIKELDLANCKELTDCSLKIIGSKCADLRALNISYLHNLTDLGMEHLANGCNSIQKLKLCSNGFSDEAMASFLECCGECLTELSLNNVRKVGQNTALSLAKCSRKLLSLDLSWCRGIKDEGFGLIVDNCSSLKLLKAFGCKQITAAFLNGHSNPVVQILGLRNLTPILNNINLVEPEAMLLRYSSLPS